MCNFPQALDEHDPEDVGEDALDAEIEKLLKGLLVEHGSSRQTRRKAAARRGDMDEVKMITVAVYTELFLGFPADSVY